MASQDIVIGIKTQFDGNMGKTLDDLDSKVKDVTKSVDKLGDAEEKTGKQSKQAGKSFASSVKEIATGIGVAKLAEGAFGLLKDAFMSNQAVADALKGVMEGVNIIFQQVVGVIIEAVKQTYESTNGFEGLFAVMKGGITIALTPLKAAFYAVKLAIAETQLLWEKSPFGSGDDKRIKELTADVDAAANSLKEVGVDAVNAGADIVNNIGKAIDEVGTVIGKSIEGIKKISIEGALAQGKALVQLENNAKKSEAQAQRLNAKYETQAEKLRQIRDDDTKSIAERTDANKQLEAVLNQQEQTLLKNVDIQVAAAQARKNANNTIENQVALTNALAQKDQVLSDIEGKRSEQKQNEVALRKESIELTQSEIDKNIEYGLKVRENSIARIKDEEQRLVEQRKSLEDEKLIELTRLDDKVKSYKEGTQARVDAEKEYLLKKEEIDNSILLKDDEINNLRAEKNKARLNRELQDTIDNEKEKVSEITAGSPARIEAEGNILKMQLDYYNTHKKDLFKNDEEYAAKKREIERQITDNDRAEQEARKQNAFSVSQEVLGQLTSAASAIGQLDQVTTQNKLKGVVKGSEAEKKILKESFERQKKLSIATTLINGAQAIVAALATPDPTLGILTAIRIAGAIATTGIQVAAIKAQQFDGGGSQPASAGPPPGSSGPPTGGGGGPSAPSTIGLGTVNITERKKELQFQQVYVVESDIRNVTNKVETIENRSILGS
jgi:hypothetical protein